MKTLIILLSEPSASGNMYGFMAILGVFALAVLLIYLNRRADRSIEKAINKLQVTMQKYLDVVAETLHNQTLIVDVFYKRLEENKEFTPEEIRAFSVKMSLCPASFFEDRKDDRYPSLSAKIAKCLDGKWEEVFLGKKNHSPKEMEKIIQANAEQLEKIITQELYPV